MIGEKRGRNSRVFCIDRGLPLDFCFRRFFPFVFCIAGRNSHIFYRLGKKAPLCKGRYNVTCGQLQRNLWLVGGTVLHARHFLLYLRRGELYSPAFAAFRSPFLLSRGWIYGRSQIAPTVTMFCVFLTQNSRASFIPASGKKTRHPLLFLRHEYSAAFPGHGAGEQKSPVRRHGAAWYGK